MASQNCSKGQAGREKLGRKCHQLLVSLGRGVVQSALQEGRQVAHRDDTVAVLHPSIPGAQTNTLFPELRAYTGL
jgi:hypothetical protein